MEQLKPGEKCAVAASVGDNSAAVIADSLFALQHRGTEASGIATQNGGGSLHYHRETGMVKDVYREEDIARLAGSVAVGHNKYTTNGDDDKHLQPVIDRAAGFAMAHNGNLPVTNFLETYLHRSNINTSQMNDSEMMGHSIAQFIRNGQPLPNAVDLAFPMFRGSFSAVAMHDGLVVAFRDSSGIRPLALGRNDEQVVVSSETCGLDIVGAEYIREVEPGEMVIIDQDGKIESRMLTEGEDKLDIFEFVYFARHDSQLYGQRVNEVRRRFGEELAEQHPPITDDVENILVVPVPDTSVPAAEGYADKLGLRHRQAIIKNRYIGRTFMQPRNEIRESQLKRKHNMIPEAIAGRDIIMIDDSIVRLNTMPRLVEQAYAAGAKSVTVLIASPPVRFPDFYGIDTPTQSELAAANLTIDQIREKIACNSLGYLSLSRMISATNRPATDFCLSSFTGEYPIPIGDRIKEVKKPVSMEFAE